MPAHSRLLIWLRSLRPGTLPLAAISIIQGSALAAHKQAFIPRIALFALLTATLLQILSNLANDYGDAIRGSDNTKRIGPWRGMQTGAITAAQMRRALWLCGVACVISGSLLIAFSCSGPGNILGFVLLGLLAITAALGYTLGRHAYGYFGLGDLSVLIFFGWVGVVGSYYLQTGHFDAKILLPATASGLFATAVLNINNLRDIESDALAGKRTLAVRLGPVRARRYHAVLLFAATLCLVLFSAAYLIGWSRWLFLLALPPLYFQARKILSEHSTQAMQPMLPKTVQAVILLQLLFAIGIVMSRTTL
ncbi:MAG: 1,4-dihydroxy-2-naphthoate polyprenyltransferase [Betaproteobacteria bacterium]|nr:1,4-dihydroxy-2-naphthoate polyprenyltransferase [Betaproteobacteria bacterium]